MQLHCNIWGAQNLCVMGASSAVIAWHARKSVGTPAACLWFYCLMSGVWIYSNPWYEDLYQNVIDLTVADALVKILLVPCAAYVALRWKSLVLDLLMLVAAVDCILLWTLDYGIWNVKSCDTACIAMMIPALFWRRERTVARTVLMMLVVLTVLVRGKSTGVFSLGAATLVYDWGTTASYVSAGLIGLGGWLSYGNKLVNDSQRFDAWRAFLNWWTYHMDGVWGWMFGSGVGTFERLGPTINPGSPQLFFWAHDDYLQWLFEGGVLGLGILCWMIGSLVVWSRGQRWKLATIAGCATSAIAQFPMHFTLSSFFICFMSFLIYEERNDASIS